jgi:hypothetical protein
MQARLGIVALAIAAAVTAQDKVDYVADVKFAVDEIEKQCKVLLASSTCCCCGGCSRGCRTATRRSSRSAARRT